MLELLERFVAATEAIAAALNSTGLPNKPSKVSAATEDTDSAPKVAKKKTPRKKAPRKKAAAKAKPEPKEEKENSDTEVTKENVRDSLQTLQKATSPAEAKALLLKYGAATLGKLDPAKYQDVINSAKKMLNG